MTKDIDEPESNSSTLRRGGMATFAIKVVAVGLGFLAQFLIARSLGTAGYGEFAFALVTLNFLVIAAVAGSDSVATRFVSQFRESPGLLVSCLRWLNRRALWFSVCFLIASLVIVQVIRQLDSRTIWVVTQVFCIAIPLQVFSSLRAGILKGRQQPALSQIPEELIRPLTTILLVVGAASFWPESWNSFSAIHVAVLLLFVSLVVFASGQWILNRVFPKPSEDPSADIDSDTIETHFRQWSSMAWASTFAAIAMTIHSQCDVWMLGLMVESEMVGPYAAAARYAAFVVFGINAINTALGPMIANSVGQNEKLQRLASQAALLSAALSAGVVAVLLLLPQTLLGLFGPGFDQADLPLKILVIANAFNVLCGSVGMLLNMSGHHNEFMRILVLSLILNLILNGILIPIYQTTGAAIATGVSIISWNVLGVILVKKKLGIRPTLGGWI